METITYNNSININKSAVALGKFEGLHKGHMILIDKIISLADENNLNSVLFSIDMNCDKVLNTKEERNMIFAEKKLDYIVECLFTKEFANMSPEDFVKNVLISNLHVSYVVVGTDFRFGNKRAGDVSMLTEFGNKYGFHVIPVEKLSVDDVIVSSSYIKSMLECGNVSHIEKFLGRKYSVSGIVYHGKMIGRTIGFPTINLIPDDKKIIPEVGVYETLVEFDGETYKGVTNIGTNPTVNSGQNITIETNILDFDGDLYGKRVTIYFVRHIRNQIKFNTIDELKLQIAKDKESVMHQ